MFGFHFKNINVPVIAKISHVTIQNSHFISASCVKTYEGADANFHTFLFQFHIAVYPNGTVVKKVTAYDYSKFETYSIKPSPILKYCSPYCDDLLCMRVDSTYQVPSALTSRGLQVCFYFIYSVISCQRQ